MMRCRLPAMLCGMMLAGSMAQGALTHRYTFNDGTANDSVGKVNGTLVNGASIRDGQLVFDPVINNGTNTDAGIGQYMTLPENILKTQDFTIEAWYTNNGGAAWQRLVDFGNSVPDPQGGTKGVGFIILTQNGLGQISLNSTGAVGDTDATSAPETPDTGTQHHMVYTYSLSTGSARIYVDGVAAKTGKATVDGSAAKFSNFWIGRSQFSVDPFFNGSINELRFYDHALNAAQVKADFAAGPVPTPPPSAFKQGVVTKVAGAAGVVGNFTQEWLPLIVVLVVATFMITAGLILDGRRGEGAESMGEKK